MPPKSEVNVLVKERTLFRSSVTKGCNGIQEILSKETLSEQDKIDLRSQWDVVSSRFQDLEVKDGEIRAILISDDSTTDEALELEQDKVDEYARNFYKTKNNVDRVLSEDVARSEHSSSRDVDAHSSASGVSVVTSAKVKCNLPMLKLKEFGGDLNEWLPFWSQFEKIDLDPSLTPSDKLGYLTMCMRVGSPARDLVESYPASAAIYPEVVTALTDRFGRADLLTEFYIRELLKIILHNVKSKMDIRTLYDKLQCHLRNLETLGVTSENCASILMPLVSSCLPEDILLVWERSSVHLPNRTSKDYLNNLLSFLKAEVEGSQKMEMARSGFGLGETPKNVLRRKEFKQNTPSEVNVPTATGLVNHATNQPLCIFCSKNHKPQECVAKMTSEERRKCVQDSRVCFCCLRSGHRAARCRSRPKCTKCGKGHFVIMCDSEGLKQHSLASSTVQSNVLMQTLVVKVHSTKGKNKLARLLIDTGSQRSYILSQSAKEMGYKPTHVENIQHALFGGNVTEVAEYNVYKLQLSSLDDSYHCNFQVLGQDTICSSVSTIPKGPWISELSQCNVQLSDLTYPTTVIEILVGADVAGKLYTGQLKQLSSGLVAMETHLGWCLSGKLPSEVRQCRETKATLVTTLLLKENQISDLWSLDVLGITDPTEKQTQAELELATHQHFLDTVRVRDDQRFEVDLPWIKNHPPLSDNYQLSWKRLESVRKKLDKDSLYCEYQRVFDSWEEKGIIEKVPVSDLDCKGYYMPHHPVVKIGSSTPVRPVFDASAKEGGKYSLNQCLDKGPNLIEKIPACLARFRRGKIGISGDIEKAFLQISLNEKDRDFLRFLWIDEKGQKVTYRHCRVVFGVSPSPFLLESCIKLHLENTLKLCERGEANYHVEYVKILSESFYVDNCLTSLDSIDEAKEFTIVASTIMSERMLTLRGWELSHDVSNNPTNVLGMVWHRSEDVLSINIDSLMKMNLSRITKKVILSAAHRVFDPIGIISSFALIPKLLLQETWETKIGWNDEVSEDLRARFMKWMEEVSLIPNVRVPRCVTSLNLDEGDVSVHVFSDASKLAYAAAVYLRVEYESKVTVQLLASRARVAPTSKSKAGMTIPRLELLAASIATRLYKTVVEDFKLQGTQTIFWTDATTVLAWIRRNEPWNIFVLNRIKEIRDISNSCEWRHVPGENNPADLPSRGSSMKKLLECRWWEGPSWLKEDPENWPQSDVNFNESDINMELKKSVVSAMVSTVQTVDTSYYQYFSSYTKLVRMIAWIHRFKTNCAYKKSHGHLPEASDITSEEFEKAERKVFISIQNENTSAMSKVESLFPFVEEGLIRLKTKVSNREDDKDFCYPIVLFGEHPVVQRLIISVHVENCHAGVQMLLAILRKRFWIIGGRRIIRSILNTCIVCKRYSAKKLETQSLPLPIDRVRDAKVFEITGVDFAGPLFVKNDDGSPKKVWICLFTCAVYRAVRLELVSSLSTHGFVQALRRFTSRQGRPSVIYSDNGSNFVGFNNACELLDWNKVATFSSVRRIMWRFNPPSAPWWGGWFERLIGLLKKLLRRVLGRTSVDFEELQTLICECECTINQRPLTYMSENSSELACITPSMFLQDLDEVGVPEYDLIKPVDIKGRLKYCQDLRKQINERFRLEYLGQLQLFSSKNKHQEIKLGDIVLIGDDNAKRIDWPIARVVSLFPGGDGHVRAVRLRTSSGVLTRPIQRIYPLEFASCPGDMLPSHVHEERDDVSDVDLVQPAVDISLGSPTVDSHVRSLEQVEPMAQSSHESDLSQTESSLKVKEVHGPIGEIKSPLFSTRLGRHVKKPSKLDL